MKKIFKSIPRISHFTDALLFSLSEPPRWPSGKPSASRAVDLGSIPSFAAACFRPGHTSDLRTGTPVATLPGARRCRAIGGNSWSGVRILGLGKIQNVIGNHGQICQTLGHLQSSEQILP